jgi:predicted exporter
MGASQLRVVVAGLFLLLVFLSGFQLGHSGAPYGSTLLLSHQVTAFAALVFLTITLYRIGRMAAFSAAKLIVCALTGLFLLGAIISGGLIIGEKPVPELAAMLHKLFAFLSAFFVALTFYLSPHRK